MGKDMYHPTDNYERNFLLVKRFGGKFIILFIPVLMLMNIICMGYISITKHELMEVTLLKVVTTKIRPDFNATGLETACVIISCLVMLYFIFVFMEFFLTSKDPSDEAVPNVSLRLAYTWSVVQLILSVIGLISSLFFLVLFVVKGEGYFEGAAAAFNVTLNQLKAYRMSIILISVLLCLIFVMMIWFSQSQTQFVKSIRLTLVNSVAKNNGAHTYGVFSMSVAVALLFIAGMMTFIYYCYMDAFSGLGISMEKTYVCVSLILAYIRGLIPFFVAVCALTYSEMVDEANTLGTVYYSEVDTLGEVQDPNMNRKKHR